MMRRLILSLCVWGVVGSASAQDVLHWETDLATAQRAAAQTNRLLLLHFTAEWCGPCKEMEKSVFNQPGLGTAIGPYYVAVKIDVDKEPALAKHHGAPPIPLDVVVTPQGQVLARHVGSCSAAEYVARLNRAAQRGVAANRAPAAGTGVEQAGATQAAPPAAQPTVATSPYLPPASPYAAPTPPYAAPNSPYAAPNSPYAAPNSPYAAPTAPYTPPTSPYAAAPAAANRELPAAAAPASPGAAPAVASTVGSRYSTTYTPPTGSAQPAPSAPPAAVASTNLNGAAPTTPIAQAAPTSAPGDDRYAYYFAGRAPTPPAQSAVTPGRPAPPYVAPPTASSSTAVIATPTAAAPTNNIPAGPTNTPPPQATATNSSHLGSRYAASSVGDRYATLPANETSPTTNPAPSMNSTAGTTPTAQRPQVAVAAANPAPAVAAQSTTNVAAAQVAPSSTANPTGPALPTTPDASKPAAAPAAPVATLDQIAPGPAVAKSSSSVAATAPTAVKEKQAAELAALQSQIPAGSPPLALDGYCPVTVTEKMVWKRGDPAFGAIHKGRTYLFASATEQQKFLAKPDSFSPIISGNDPVAILEEGRLVGGSRDHGMFCGGQMILFASAENYEKFRRDQQRYVVGLQQAMQKGVTLRR